VLFCEHSLTVCSLSTYFGFWSKLEFSLIQKLKILIIPSREDNLVGKNEKPIVLDSVLW
jgi:hypothetical protein